MTPYRLVGCYQLLRSKVLLLQAKSDVEDGDNTETTPKPGFKYLYSVT
jgi:hypothetical protein